MISIEKNILSPQISPTKWKKYRLNVVFKWRKTSYIVDSTNLTILLLDKYYSVILDYVFQQRFSHFILLASKIRYYKDYKTTFIDITSNDMKHFLDVVTKRKIIDESSLNGVFNVAHRYDSPHIKNKCEDFIIQIFHTVFNRLKEEDGIRTALNYRSSRLVLAHKYNFLKLANFLAQEIEDVHNVIESACDMAKVKAINYDMMKILISNTKGKKFCKRTEVLIKFSVTGNAKWTGEVKFELFRDLCFMHDFVFEYKFRHRCRSLRYVKVRLKERAIMIEKHNGVDKWAGLASEANNLAPSHGICLVAWLCKCENVATSYITLGGHICQKRCEGSDCYQIVFGGLVGDKSAIEYLSQQDDDTQIYMMTYNRC